MHSLGVQAALVALLMSAVIVKAEEGGVEFWRETVTLICPEEGNWYDNNNKVFNGTRTYTFKFERQSQMYCEYDGPIRRMKYSFYVKGRTCENCFELDAFIMGTAIVVDLMVTVAVMTMVYRCTKKKGSDRPTQTSKRPPAPARPGDRGTTTTSGEGGYEPLNPHTRSQDPYSTVNRMG
ncbi:T-cell surface glycoprotein CD3 epsilon chain-like [Cololabis saira]|uniref:T-cell surface glycoprotein CD3 epsilon chain-like n=1 Tax=Cololabis saira TaxID=129043 RepID=UPI002AD4DAFB|nr:T-cell surface glycoprotein CD3 epsilon chain-like [Cololabis saira]